MVKLLHSALALADNEACHLPGVDYGSRNFGRDHDTGSWFAAAADGFGAGIPFDRRSSIV